MDTQREHDPAQDPEEPKEYAAEPEPEGSQDPDADLDKD